MALGTSFIRHWRSDNPHFAADFAKFLQAEEASDAAVEQQVAEILSAVRQHGDSALRTFCQRFDGHLPADATALEIPLRDCQQALSSLSSSLRQALEEAAERLRRHAEKQRLHSWGEEDEQGSFLGEQISALERVGLYVPGGQAAYPSSVLMNAIPARVAGVQELFMTTPTPAGKPNPLVLAAAALAEVDRVFCIGGAQAVAALAFGTKTVPRVDKIVGPGNRYVATAKRQVFGRVGIDMLAGPSEVLIISDGTQEPDWLAWDLFSQAEHDGHARAMLFSPDAAFLQRVEEAMRRLLEQQPRRAVIATALADHGLLLCCRDLDEAAALANQVAAEHLELLVPRARHFAHRIRHAGAIFLGPWSAEVFGDYCAGPNHVLPTAATARFSSPLGTYDFQKRSSLIELSARAASQLAPIAAKLAREEGLHAHAGAAEKRSSCAADSRDS